MHALNIMWLLNEVDCNTEIEILTGKSKHVDSIMISTNDFEFSISECGTCVLTYLNQPKSVEKILNIGTWLRLGLRSIIRRASNVQR